MIRSPSAFWIYMITFVNEINFSNLRQATIYQLSVLNLKFLGCRLVALEKKPNHFQVKQLYRKKESFWFLGIWLSTKTTQKLQSTIIVQSPTEIVSISKALVISLLGIKCGTDNPHIIRAAQKIYIERDNAKTLSKFSFYYQKRLHWIHRLWQCFDKIIQNCSSAVSLTLLSTSFVECHWIYLSIHLFGKTTMTTMYIIMLNKTEKKSYHQNANGYHWPLIY